MRRSPVSSLPTKQIFEHLKDVPLSIQDQEAKLVQKQIPSIVQNQESNALRIADIIKEHPVGIAIAAGVVVVGIIGGIYFAVKSSKSKQAAEPEVPKCVEDYNAALHAYLEAARNRNLDTEIINRLIVALDTVKKSHDGNMIRIDFSTEELDTLIALVQSGRLDTDTLNCLISDSASLKNSADDNAVGINYSTEKFGSLVGLVYNHTKKLAEANSFEMHELEKPKAASADNIIYMQNYLDTQRQIFEKAA